MQHSQVLLLTGDPGTGKTMTLKRLLPLLREAEISFAGILAPGRYPDPGEKEYDLELLPGGESFFLSTRSQRPGWHPVGGFFFNPEAIDAGLRHLQYLPAKQYDLYLLDEIGPFELEGRLWAPAIPALLDSGTPMIWTVRSRIVKRVKHRWNLDPAVVLTLKEGGSDKAEKEILSWLEKATRGLS